MAMARADSVTVSMAAATKGIFISILLVNLVLTSTWDGSTPDLTGINKTSSNVNASFKGFIETPFILQ
jgi:hypothetical protein